MFWRIKPILSVGFREHAYYFLAVYGQDIKKSVWFRSLEENEGGFSFWEEQSTTACGMHGPL